MLLEEPKVVSTVQVKKPIMSLIIRPSTSSSHTALAVKESISIFLKVATWPSWRKANRSWVLDRVIFLRDWVLDELVASQAYEKL